MSRNSLFVIMGSMWTLTTVLFFFQMSNPIDVTTRVGLSLAVCTTICAMLFFMACDLQSEALRAVAFVSHLCFPMFWAQMVAASMGVVLEPVGLSVLGLTSLIGAGLSDVGVYLEREKLAASRGQELVLATKCGTLLSFEDRPSLLTRPRPLAACESGSFPTL